jgi:hypothetical protein
MGRMASRHKSAMVTLVKLRLSSRTTPDADFHAIIFGLQTMSTMAVSVDHFDYLFQYDEIANPIVIEDRPHWRSMLPAYAATVAKRTMDYDDLYRLIGTNYTYGTPSGAGPWLSNMTV